MRRIRRPSHATVIAYLALFVALGGTAMASLIITSNSQVASNTISGHKPPSGKHANIIAGSINGKDIADRSGVDTCKAPLVKKFGAICAGSDGVARTWYDAISRCSSLGLRLPSFSEAMTLSANYDVPGVSGSQVFWTDEDTGSGNVQVVNDASGAFLDSKAASHQTVCVTDPSA